ncbi:MAG TPA: 1-deoxy-D-xylulose-5-phosphate reductoisomerase, partial [Thiotrichales bacterium]|nr:1-deoxy-D-xylulose-5-phosphate reductoisomerase [Thiotrichales bacterium]
GVEPLNIFDVAKLEFEQPDLARFPCLRLCYEAIETGGSACVVLNAANEIAVEAFLAEKIAFTAIAAVVEETLQQATITPDVRSLERILAADREARALAAQCVLAH